MCGTGCNFYSIVTKICVCLANGPRTDEFQLVILFMEVLIFTQ